MDNKSLYQNDLDRIIHVRVPVWVEQKMEEIAHGRLESKSDMFRKALLDAICKHDSQKTQKDYFEKEIERKKRAFLRAV